MLSFSEEFFYAEEKCGFYIDVTMKTVWAAELEVLYEIALVCERHDIPWFMAYGSLLGAVRHEGFIPWDDDIDIYLFRNDYQKLLKILPKELPDGYIVKSPLLKTGYPEYHSCVVNSDSISIEPGHLQRFHGCPFVVGVDIFPIDALPMDENVLEQGKRAFQLIRKAVQIVKRDRDLKTLEAVVFELKNDFGICLYSGDVYLPQNVHEANEMAAHFWRYGNEIVTNMSDEEMSNKVCVFISYVKRGCQYEKEWFEEIRTISFEGFGVPVPKEYDKILRVEYDDYNIYKQAEAGHDYPFYNKQLEDLRKRVKEMENV